MRFTKTLVAVEIAFWLSIAAAAEWLFFGSGGFVEYLAIWGILLLVGGISSGVRIALSARKRRASDTRNSN